MIVLQLGVMKKAAEHEDIDLTLGDAEHGLSAEEASQRIRDGYHNAFNSRTSKTYGEIFKHNLLQFFNFVLYGIVILFLVFSAVLRSMDRADLVTKYFGFSKYLFVGPVTINIIISIIQEIRSKVVLDKLRLVTEAKITVIRDGQSIRIPTKNVVYGDLVQVQVGEQCPVDLQVVSGKAEADESMLTGESETVHKSPEEGENFAYGGSVLMSGSLRGLAVAVGPNTYANKLSKKLKDIEKSKSELMKSIYTVINAMAFVLLIMLLMVTGTMIYKIIRWGGDPLVFGTSLSLDSAEAWCEMIVTASAFAIGVLPTGLVLVTSMALAASVVILAKQNTLVQELYSLENLSRVNTICLDKTGTLTDGTMSVEQVVYFAEEEETNHMISTTVSAMASINLTAQALLNHFGNACYEEVVDQIPFSSERKSTAVTLQSGTKLMLGAPEYLTKDKKVLAMASDFQKEGKRVLAFVKNGKPCALIVLKDGIRKSAPETIAYFVEAGVDVKIISGDNIETVSKIAAVCGVPNADRAISLEGVPLEKIDEICMDYVIFGRVSPEQKEALVDALQRHGRKVAMTGDGVNDLLALRKANSSITFEKATDAAKSCADVVLIDNDFSHLKEVVGQGRKVVNNTQRSSILFFMKTFFVITLSFVLIPFPAGHMVFSIENIYMMQTAVIAVGGFLLSFEPTKKPIEGTFKKNVYPKALAAAFALLAGTLIPVFMFSFQLISIENRTSLISILTTIAGIVVLIRLSYPFTKYRAFVLGAVIFSAMMLALLLPKTYLGGMPTSVADITSGELGREAMQPWNSPVYRNLLSEPTAWITLLAYIVLSYPITFLVEKGVYLIGAKFIERITHE